MNINFKDITNGQVFYECACGKNKMWTAQENTRVTGKSYRLFAKTKQGQLIELMRDDFGPNMFYDQPFYGKTVNGVETFTTI